MDAGQVMNTLNTLLMLLMLLLPVIVILRGRSARRRKTDAVIGMSQDVTGFLTRYREVSFLVRCAYGMPVEAAATSPDSEGAPEDAGIGGEDPRGLQEETATEEKPDFRPIAVLSFDGGLRAYGAEAFGMLVDEVVINSDRLSEVVVCIKSGGGVVPRYGYLVAQMERLRTAVPNLTACIDTIAASGGYWMAIPAAKIIAVRSAVVGSLGAMMLIPNVSGLLSRLGIEVHALTAGEDKFPLNPFTPWSEEPAGAIREQLTATQEVMLSQLAERRPQANLELVRKARVWSAQQSVEQGLGLVDELGTSEEYLLRANETRDLVYLSIRPRPRGLLDLLRHGLPHAMRLLCQESCV